MNIPGLNDLWKETLGDPNICVAILDGPVDQNHPSLSGANLRQLETSVSISENHGPAFTHGTHIASLIFGQHNGRIKGIAPICRGLCVPIFTDGIDDSIAPCSQLDLARAITQAVQEGAHIINISGGELTPTGTAHPILVDAVKKCTDNGVLIVAAVGNNGCDCLQIPGALPAVLAVGSMNEKGQPLDFSNWGEKYQTQGILAPGENILGAIPGFGITSNSGTSYSTPLVSGIAALLLCLQRKRGDYPKPHVIREALLDSAVACDKRTSSDCRRFLAGRLNISGAITYIINGGNSMSDSTEILEKILSTEIETADGPSPSVQTNPSSENVRAATADINSIEEPNPTVPVFQTNEGPTHQLIADTVKISASTCGTCSGGMEPLQIVFALGRLGYDFGNEARRDSITQHMDPPANPYDPSQLMTYLEKNPWDASAIHWTLNLDATPIYAIQAKNAFASEIYNRLREYLAEQTSGEIERISIPGYIGGSTQLSNGQIVPVIWPSLRGMYSWNTVALGEATSVKPQTSKAKTSEKDESSSKANVVVNFCQRVYEELRNLGMSPQERAINYAATNAFQVAAVFEDALKSGMDLDSIEVERSPVCRPESNCWDVKLGFFNPNKVFEQAKKIYLFTVDVSDVVPVMVGTIRSWFTR